MQNISEYHAAAVCGTLLRQNWQFTAAVVLLAAAVVFLSAAILRMSAALSDCDTVAV